MKQRRDFFLARIFSLRRPFRQQRRPALLHFSVEQMHPMNKIVRGLIYGDAVNKQVFGLFFVRVPARRSAGDDMNLDVLSRQRGRQSFESGGDTAHTHGRILPRKH